MCQRQLDWEGWGLAARKLRVESAKVNFLRLTGGQSQNGGVIGGIGYRTSGLPVWDQMEGEYKAALEQHQFESHPFTRGHERA